MRELSKQAKSELLSKLTLCYLQRTNYLNKENQQKARDKFINTLIGLENSYLINENEVNYILDKTFTSYIYYNIELDCYILDDKYINNITRQVKLYFI